ncbi:MAG: hypothetical protein ACREKE_00450, partial [bacterium]
SLGLRGEYLETNPATDDLSTGIDPSLDFIQKGTLTGILLGGRYQFPGSQYGLKLSLGAFGGLAYGTMSQGFSSPEGGVPGLLSTSLYQGEGFMADLDLRLNWAVPHVSWLHISAQGGYRYASLGQFSSGGKPMTDGASELLNAVDTGTPGTTVPPHAEDVDFSGLTGEGALTASF